jgi:hypothetical protein
MRFTDDLYSPDDIASSIRLTSPKVSCERAYSRTMNKALCWDFHGLFNIDRNCEILIWASETSCSESKHWSFCCKCPITIIKLKLFSVKFSHKRMISSFWVESSDFAIQLVALRVKSQNSLHCSCSSDRLIYYVRREAISMVKRFLLPVDLPSFS